MVASALKHEEQGDAPRVLWRRLNTLATLLVVAGVVYLFLSISGVNRASMARLPDLINGTAYRPWVYRVLVPKTVGLLVALTPDAVADGLEQLFEDTPAVVTLMRQLVVRPADYVAAFYMSCVLFASLLGYKRAFRYLAASFYAEHWTLELASYIALAALVPFFQFCYIYDFTALFFGTLLLALIVREHWRAYLIAFGLACLNKETTLVFVLVFAACAHGSLTTREYRKQIAKQLAVFAVVRGALMLTYARNPGSEVQHFFDYHLSMYSEFGTQAQYSLLGWLSLLFCVFYGFSHKPRALRLSLIGVPPIAALYLAFGYPFEWRVFYELLAPALLLALHGIYRLVARTDPQPLVA